MNHTLEVSLLSTIFPAIAIAIIFVLEGRGRDSTAEVLEPSKLTVAVQPKIKVLQSRKQ